ncbi:MAG: hypothetical protein KDA45_11060 [Planctomycetales bacterium]|nr:hypothetical protein [Planctomycetales bacterium]
MIHYSCDRCRCPIAARHTVRYIVRMEIEATIDTGASEMHGMDQDGLLEMDQMLEQLEEGVMEDAGSVLYQRKQYDLCPDCYRKFVKNPMGSEKVIPFGFSHN